MVHAVLDAVDVLCACRLIAVVGFGIGFGFGIERADASCAVALEGDAAVVDGVRAELADFADDSAACVTLWVQCRRASDQLEIDLHDELGRSTLRLFASARGAAAFIVSWSRRPLAMHITAIEPPGPHPAPVAAIAAPGAASQDQPWHLEFNAGALVASGIYPYWGTTAAALVRQTSMFRFGGALRMMTGGYLGHVVGEVTGSFGVVDAPSDRLTAIAELTAGSTIRGDTTESGADFGADGLRAGVRAMIDRRLAGPLRLQVGGGIDVLRRLVIPSAVAEPSTPSGSYIDYALCPHIEAGLRWAP